MWYTQTKAVCCRHHLSLSVLNSKKTKETTVRILIFWDVTLCCCASGFRCLWGIRCHQNNRNYWCKDAQQHCSEKLGPRRPWLVWNAYPFLFCDSGTHEWILLISGVVADLTDCTGVWQLSLVTITFTFSGLLVSHLGLQAMRNIM